MSKRIDLTELEEQFKDGLNWDDMNTMELIAELKRCYEEIDRLMHVEACYIRAVEIYDPDGKRDELSHAIQKAFDE